VPQLAALAGVRVLSLHGRMKQKQRTKVYQDFSKNYADRAGQTVVLLTTDLAARGLDIPDVDWVVQFDPPQNPDTFVHRVGRTARMGRAGAALVYLLPQEDAYVQFMQVRKVPLLAFEEHAAEHGCAAEVYGDLAAQGRTLLLDVKAAAKQDREVFEKGERAFVSFVAGYQEHTCNFIFRWAAMDVGQLRRGPSFILPPPFSFIWRISIRGTNNTDE
jgi:ATP-dependent RNA helicase DDX55/SPB4